MNKWPGQWISGAEKMAEQQEFGFTNDDGILYLVGDPREGEWLHMHDIPTNMENHC